MVGKIPQYLSRYSLERAPFGLLPDPDFFFPAPPHLSARETLKYTIESGEGFMVLIGEAGTGKTLLVRVLLREINKNKVPAILISPMVTPTELLRLILVELGEEGCQADDMATLLARFQRTLLDLAGKGKELLIIVDEAQNLPVDSLEQLRMLSNIETNNRKLLQILLVGQPGLKEKLQDPALGQLSQRVVVTENLRPFDLKESVEYINFRLARAGQGGLDMSRGAGKLLYKDSMGIPRLINRLMDRTLLFGCADISDGLTITHVRRAMATLPETGRRERRFLLWPKKIFFSLVILLAVVAGCILFPVIARSPAEAVNDHSSGTAAVVPGSEKGKKVNEPGSVSIRDIIVRQQQERVENKITMQ